MKKSIVSLVVSAAMAIAPLPAMSADSGPLPAAPAAGVKQAQAVFSPVVIWLMGAGVVLGAGVLILANNNNGHATVAGPVPPATTTTTTGA